jgi:hypothetical protein
MLLVGADCLLVRGLGRSGGGDVVILTAAGDLPAAQRNGHGSAVGRTPTVHQLVLPVDADDRDALRATASGACALHPVSSAARDAPGALLPGRARLPTPSSRATPAPAMAAPPLPPSTSGLSTPVVVGIVVGEREAEALPRRGQGEVGHGEGGLEELGEDVLGTRAGSAGDVD